MQGVWGIAGALVLATSTLVVQELVSNGLPCNNFGDAPTAELASLKAARRFPRRGRGVI